PSRPRITSAEWDELRHAFGGSLLAQASLAALAENIDGCVWPVQHPQETPAAYLDLAHTEVLARLAGLGLPSDRFDTLVEILRGTLSFDESFGDMVAVAGKAEADLDPVARNLERLGIPPDFPVALCQFRPTTMEFCRREKIVVIADFLAFARTTTTQVIVASEFRDLLNAVSHIDERTLARHLPFRPKSIGLHLVEGLALLVRGLREDQREGVVLDPATLPTPLQARAHALALHFIDQLRALREAFRAGTPLSRLVAPLDELLIEPAVATLLQVHLTSPDPVPAPVAPPAKPGLLARLRAFLGL
ncbi:MAG: hypothetical protein H7067_00175, partial [Burkholderiales bacterium]|nr:hypothetical protein [Opitutaceae bacterium]